MLHVLLVRILHLLFLEKTATFAELLRTVSCNDIQSITQFQLKTGLNIFFRTNSKKGSRYSIFRIFCSSHFQGAYFQQNVLKYACSDIDSIRSISKLLHIAASFLNDSLFSHLQEYNLFHIYDNVLDYNAGNTRLQFPFGFAILCYQMIFKIAF